MLPWMVPAALVGHMVEYRLIAYRMTRLTCRPFPRGAEGIGPWQDVFEGIACCGILCQAGMSCFVGHPLNAMGWTTQVLAFLGLEHGVLFLRGLVRWAIPDEPEDVRRI